MLYLNNNELNTLYLNINNNSRDTATTYTLDFLHVLSHDEKTYTIDTSDSAQYASNDRFCELNLILDLVYEGEYKLTINLNGATKVYETIAIVGSQTQDFITYESDNENNSSYIYIED